MDKKLNTLIGVGEFRLKLYPKNFDLVRHFYEEVLEFPVTNEWNDGEKDRGVMFRVGGAIIELLSTGKEYVPVAGCSVSLEVGDVRELWKQWQDSDAVVFPIRDNDWGDTSFAVTDPEGFKITFFTKT